MSDRVEGRWAEIFGPKYIAPTTILCLGVSLLAFNSFLSTTTMPSAVRELDGVELISWSTTLFLVFAIVGGAASPLIKQRLGARLALIGMATIFAVGTLIASFASTMSEVLIGRAIQGLGEGAVAALCFALIPVLFPNRLMPKVFGTQAIIWAIAGMAGPAGAGALTEFLSWRAAFLVNVPLALIFCAMVFFVVPKSVPSTERTRFPGLRLFGIGFGILLIAIAAIRPWQEALLLVVAAAVILVGIIWLDKRSPNPLTPTGAFWSRNAIGPGFWVVLLTRVADAISATYLLILLQQMWGYGPLLAGMFTVALALAWSASSVWVANVKHRATRKILIQCGPLLLALGLFGVLLGLQLAQPALVFVAQILIGISFGSSNSYTMLSLIEASSLKERDSTSTLVPTTQSAGNAIGAAIAGLVANAAGYAYATRPEQMLSTTIPLYSTAIAIALVTAYAARLMVSRMTEYVEPQA